MRAVAVQVAEQLLLQLAVVGVGLDALQILGDVVRQLLGAVCASLMIRLRVRNMRPHDATPTVTATLTAISQILVRIVTVETQSYPDLWAYTRERRDGSARLE